MTQVGSFDREVLKVVSLIHFPRLATYGQIVDLINEYGSAREVSWFLKCLPLVFSYPCNRLVNTQGRISMSIGRHGSDFL